MAVSVAAYDSAFGGVPIALSDSWERRFQDRLSATGGFSLRVQNDDTTALNACGFGRILRFDESGVAVFAGVVEEKIVHSVAQGEEVDQYTDISGRGTLALHESFVVYPEILDNPLVGDTRFFTFASTLFDDAAWATVNAVNLSTAEQPAPANWPDTTTKKIRPGGSPLLHRAPEEFGVRKRFATTGGDKTYRLFFTGDDGVDIFIDGVRIVEEVRPRMWQETRQVDVRLRDSASHLIAIKGTNIEFPDTNYSWVAAALYNVAADGTLGSLIVQTDATWKGVQFGSTPPGFTAGAILLQLRSEAVARGVSVPTAGFTATHDSANVAWPVAPDVSFRVGLKGLAALLQLAETYCDLYMARTALRLDAWAYGAKGGPSGASLRKPTDPNDPLTGNLFSAEHRVSG